MSAKHAPLSVLTGRLQSGCVTRHTGQQKGHPEGTLLTSPAPMVKNTNCVCIAAMSHISRIQRTEPCCKLQCIQHGVKLLTVQIQQSRMKDLELDTTRKKAHLRAHYLSCGSLICNDNSWPPCARRCLSQSIAYEDQCTCNTRRVHQIYSDCRLIAEVPKRMR